MSYYNHRSRFERFFILSFLILAVCFSPRSLVEAQELSREESVQDVRAQVARLLLVQSEIDAVDAQAIAQSLRNGTSLDTFAQRNLAELLGFDPSEADSQVVRVLRAADGTTWNTRVRLARLLLSDLRIDGQSRHRIVKALDSSDRLSNEARDVLTRLLQVELTLDEQQARPLAAAMAEGVLLSDETRIQFARVAVLAERVNLDSLHRLLTGLQSSIDLKPVDALTLAQLALIDEQLTNVTRQSIVQELVAGGSTIGPQLRQTLASTVSRRIEFTETLQNSGNTQTLNAVIQSARLMLTDIDFGREARVDALQQLAANHVTRPMRMQLRQLLILSESTSVDTQASRVLDRAANLGQRGRQRLARLLLLDARQQEERIDNLADQLRTGTADPATARQLARRLFAIQGEMPIEISGDVARSLFGGADMTPGARALIVSSVMSGVNSTNQTVAAGQQAASGGSNAGGSGDGDSSDSGSNSPFGIAQALGASGDGASNATRPLPSSTEQIDDATPSIVENPPVGPPGPGDPPIEPVGTNPIPEVPSADELPTSRIGLLRRVLNRIDDQLKDGTNLPNVVPDTITNPVNRAERLLANRLSDARDDLEFIVGDSDDVDLLREAVVAHVAIIANVAEDLVDSNQPDTLELPGDLVPEAVANRMRQFSSQLDATLNQANGRARAAQQLVARRLDSAATMIESSLSEGLPDGKLPDDLDGIERALRDLQAACDDLLDAADGVGNETVARVGRASEVAANTIAQVADAPENTVSGAVEQVGDSLQLVDATVAESYEVFRSAHESTANLGAVVIHRVNELSDSTLNDAEGQVVRVRDAVFESLDDADPQSTIKDVLTRVPQPSLSLRPVVRRLRRLQHTLEQTAQDANEQVAHVQQQAADSLGEVIDAISSLPDLTGNIPPSDLTPDLPPVDALGRVEQALEDFHEDCRELTEAMGETQNSLIERVGTTAGVVAETIEMTQQFVEAQGERTEQTLDVALQVLGSAADDADAAIRSTHKMLADKGAKRLRQLTARADDTADQTTRAVSDARNQLFQTLNDVAAEALSLPSRLEELPSAPSDATQRLRGAAGRLLRSLEPAENAANRVLAHADNTTRGALARLSQPITIGVELNNEERVELAALLTLSPEMDTENLIQRIRAGESLDAETRIQLLGRVASTMTSKQSGDVVITLRGPVHEAFARLTERDGSVLNLIQNRPPRALLERASRISDLANSPFEHVRGYWWFDDNSNAFQWVTGVLRRTPKGMQWALGEWVQVDAGFRRVPGRWVREGARRVIVANVSRIPIEVSGNAPTSRAIWLASRWMPDGDRLHLRPGIWFNTRPDQIYTPPEVIWTPDGFLYVDGFWDFQLTDRGRLFVPVRNPGRLTSKLVDVPKVELDPQQVFLSLFVSRGDRHLFFGDFFGERNALGMVPLVDADLGDGLSDSLLSFYRHQYARLGVDLDRRLRRWVRLFEQRPELRPKRQLIASATRRALNRVQDIATDTTVRATASRSVSSLRSTSNLGGTTFSSLNGGGGLSGTSLGSGLGSTGLGGSGLGGLSLGNTLGGSGLGGGLGAGLGGGGLSGGGLGGLGATGLGGGGLPGGGLGGGALGGSGLGGALGP